MLEIISERFVYIPIIILMMTGLYVVISTGNLVKRMVGLSLFQTSVSLIYIAVAKVFGGAPPILPEAHGEGYPDGAADSSAGADHAVVQTDHGSQIVEMASDHGSDAGHAAEAVSHAVDAAHATLYSNPLPHVLILTAIVVGVATLAVGLALVVRIREAYGTIEDDALNAADYSVETGGTE